MSSVAVYNAGSTKAVQVGSGIVVGRLDTLVMGKGIEMGSASAQQAGRCEQPQLNSLFTGEDNTCREGSPRRPYDTKGVKHAFPCDECPASIQLEGQHEHDQELKHENAQYEYRCKRCSESFYSKIYLNLHDCVLHKEAVPELCAYCSSSFGTMGDLNNHMLERHENRKSSFQCKHCNSSFIAQVLLDMHIKRVHERPTIKCHHCDFKTPLERSLRRHMVYEHPHLVSEELSTAN